jgi:hypothetical protein
MNASYREDDFSIVTSKLIRVIMKMPLEDRFQLLKELEGKLQVEKNYNRRRYNRQDCLIDVDYTIKDRLYKGFSINMSANGVFIESPRNISPKFVTGDQAMLSFDHPDKKEHVKITGKIARIDKRGIGVMFHQPIAN